MGAGRLAGAALLALALIGQPARALYSPGGDVKLLTDSNFETKVKSGGVWLVEFYAPWCGHCKALQPAWEQAAKALKGIVNVAAVDADQHKSLAGQYGIQGFPTIKLMYTSGGKIKTSDYNGGRSAKEIVGFAMDKARALAFKQLGEKDSKAGSGSGAGSGGGAGSCGGGGGGKKAGGGAGGAGGFYQGTDVVALTDSNFESEVRDSRDLWFVEFYAPWCGHCKALKPAWEEAATSLQGKVRVGAVDCTANEATCGQFGVRGYPTIKFFGENKDAPEDYQGGRDSGSITDFASRKWATLAPPPEVRELFDQAHFESECLGDGESSGSGAPKQLCFLAFLPNILDTKAEGRNRYIDMLKQLADKYKSRPFSYLWAEGGKQAALEVNFGVGGAGYPALVAYSPKQQRFSSLKGAFEVAALKEFVETVRRGYATVAPLQGDLAEVATSEPWDGSDGAVEAEDEFDLSDIMNEEL